MDLVELSYVTITVLNSIDASTAIVKSNSIFVLLIVLMLEISSSLLLFGLKVISTGDLS